VQQTQPVHVDFVYIHSAFDQVDRNALLFGSQSQIQRQFQLVVGLVEFLAEHCVIFDQIQEHDVLSFGFDGCMQLILGLLLEHLIQERRRHVRKILTREILPMVAYERIAMSAQLGRLYLLGHFVELDAIAHVYEREQSVFTSAQNIIE
jgi:hypothetical protein